MSIPKKVLSYLDKHTIKYDILEHRTVFTAFDAAQTLHVKESQIAKNLLVKAGTGFAMAVVPANRNVDFEKLAKVLGVIKVTLPKEKQLQEKFKVKPGSLTGFGGLYSVPVVVDRALLKEKKVIFSSGSLTESIQMTTLAYQKVEEVVVGSFTVAKKFKKTVTPAKKKKKPAKKRVSKKK